MCGKTSKVYLCLEKWHEKTVKSFKSPILEFYTFIIWIAQFKYIYKYRRSFILHEIDFFSNNYLIFINKKRKSLPIFRENITLRMKLDSNMRPQSIKFNNEFPNLLSQIVKTDLKYAKHYKAATQNDRWSIAGLNFNEGRIQLLLRSN